MLLFKKIKVTEDNFEEIIELLKKRCDRHRMIRFTDRYFYEEEKTYPRYRGMGFKPVFKIDYKKDIVRKKVKFFKESNYILVKKHWFREDYELDPSERSYSFCIYGKGYENFGSLIYLELDADQSHVLNREEDYVRLLPFGMFMVYTVDSLGVGSEDKKFLTTSLFVPDLAYGVINPESEKEIRKEAQSQFNDAYEEMFFSSQEEEEEDF